MSGNYCTQFGQTDLVFGMALIESLYEHVHDESEFVVLCRDEETHDFMKAVRMPQLRAVPMSDVGGGSAESEPLTLAAALLLHLHDLDSAERPDGKSVWTYLDPCSYLVGPPTACTSVQTGVAATPSSVGGALRPVVVCSAGDRQARAALDAWTSGPSPSADHAMKVSGVHHHFAALSVEEEGWLLDTTGAIFVSYEVVILSREPGHLVSEAMVRRHGGKYADALGRARAWGQSCDQEFGNAVDGSLVAGMQCAVVAYGLRERFERFAAEVDMRCVALSPIWHGLFGPAVQGDLPSPERPVLAAVRRPQGSRLSTSYSDPISPREQLRVSALVSAYASERYMAACMQDLVEQTLFQKGQLEIVVVDSASPENEAAVVKSYMAKYPNIAYQRSPKREGVYMAWNRAARVARGAYLCNANTDDRHRPDALEVLADCLDANPKVGLAYADCFVTKEHNAHFGSAPILGRLAWPAFDRDRLVHCCIIGPQPMWRRELHEEAGYFDARYRVAADYEMWLRLTQRTTAMHVDDVLGLYLNAADGVENANKHHCGMETVAIREMYIRRGQLSFDPQRYPITYVKPVTAADLKLQARFRES